MFKAQAFRGVMPAPLSPLPRSVVLQGRLHHVNTTLGQPPEPPNFDPTMSREELVRSAAELMVTTGSRVVEQLRLTHEQFDHIPQWSLTESAASAVAAGPVGAFLDAWWQSSRANHAVLKLQAIRQLAQSWVNSMNAEWLPKFVPLIDSVDPTLYTPVGDTVDAVVGEMSKVSDLLEDVRALPPKMVLEGVGIFFSDVANDMNETAQLLREILRALGEITRKAAEWPLVAVGVVLIFGFVWLTRS